MARIQEMVTRASSPAGIHLSGEVRLLDANDAVSFTGHLMRLTSEDRRDRFNGIVDNEFLARYAARSFAGNAVVFGYFEGERLVGAAEMHPADTRAAEVAFSVDKAAQGNGIGSVLFARLMTHARIIGMQRLLVTTHVANEPMKALARKFGAKLKFSSGESRGELMVPNPSAKAAITHLTETPRMLEAA